MSNPWQRQARRRKLTYLGLILALFALNTFIWRGVAVGGAPPSWTVSGQAERLGLREHQLGQVALTESMVRLSLTGSRGVVICSLWMAAEEKKKRHEWNQLELIATSLTQLQPTFSGPWIYHSWNLAYNVPAELEEGRDQYYYIARGIQLLANGCQRMPRNPDMRHALAGFYQEKANLDDIRALAALFRLSCIDPRQRDPEQLLWTAEDQQREPERFARFIQSYPQMRTRDGRWVHPDKFEQFCRREPRLARWLRALTVQEGHRTWLQPRGPGAVVDFLADNREIPGRYDPRRPGQLLPAAEQFPVLPPRFDPAEPSPDDLLDDDFDMWQAARVWHRYAAQLLPPPVPVPEYTADHLGPYRLPRNYDPIIYYCFPGVVQSQRARQLQRDGWLADGWHVDDGWRDPSARWFPEKTVILNGDRDRSAEAWRQTFATWQRFGQQLGLLLEPRELQRLEERAIRYRSAYGVRADQTPDTWPEPRWGDQSGPMMASFAAHQQLFWYHQNRRRSNFAYFYHQAAVERGTEALHARKLWHLADQLRLQGEPSETLLRAYQRVVDAWHYVLLGPPVRPELALSVDPLAGFPAGLPWSALYLASHPPLALPLEEQRHYRGNEFTQEETYKLQTRYQRLFQEVHGADIRQLLLVPDALTQALAGPARIPAWLPTAQLVPSSLLTEPIFQGPFDNQRDWQGEPLIRAEVIEDVRARGLPLE